MSRPAFALALADVPPDPPPAMTSTPPDDIDAMFDLPPLPPAEPSIAQDTAAEEAALAAELAAIIASGGVAGDAPDSRGKLRVEVSWPARMRLPGGDLLALKVRNVSEGGVGLVGDGRIPADTVVDFEMDVPPLDGAGQAIAVRGTLRTTYKVGHGPEILCGATWQGPPAGVDLVKLWIDALRRSHLE